MKSYFFFFLILINLLSTTSFGDSKTLDSKKLLLDDIFLSVRKHYPKLKQEEFKLQKSVADYKKNKGFFDPKIKGKVLNKSGYYDLFHSKISIEQNLPIYGVSLSTGWRISDGTFAVYDEILNTTNDGELFATLKLPILKNGITDKNRTKIAVSKIEKKKNKIQFQYYSMKLKYEATIAYLEWVISGYKLKTYQNLLNLALLRQKGIKEKVKLGLEPKIDIVDNQQFISQRNNLVTEAQKKFLEKSYKLSLYYRDHNGTPITPTTKNLPVLKSQLLNNNDIGSIKNHIQETVNSHPVTEYYRLKLKQTSKNIKLAKNNLLPNLDFEVHMANDLGSGGPKNINTQELKTGVNFSFPLLNRKARYNLKKKKLDNYYDKSNLSFQIDKIKNSILTALTKYNLSKKQILYTRDQWKFSTEIETAERLKFRNGSSNLLLVNLREEYTAKAKISYLEAIINYNAALAELLLTTAKF